MLPGERRSRTARPRLFVLGLAGLSLALSGCTTYVPMHQFRQAQLQAMGLYRQNQSLSARVGQLQGDLTITGQRLANLQAERAALHSQYENLLVSATTPVSPLSPETLRRFEELSRRYPDFEFDPQTGVSKFRGDLLFSSGSAEVRSEGIPVLQEIAQIMNDPDAQGFHLLVVGHTDSQPVKKPATKARHETNWDLSAHRATSVVKALASYGMSEQRLGIAGYSKYQPAASNASEPSRQQNRRVEIYVIEGDNLVANWDGPPRF